MVAVRMDSRLRARFDPSDVVQIVMAEAAQKMVTFRRQPSEFLAWLRQLAWDELARLRRDHIRTQKRSVQREMYDWRGEAADDSMFELADRFAAQQMGPGSRLVHKEIRARVRSALGQLPPQDREILVLRFLEQLDINEAAAALGISVAAVKSRQFRAVERLGKLLSDLRTGDNS
jgi:RNA polymerase sigma-70 factor (ECF subfamily)